MFVGTALALIQINNIYKLTTLQMILEYFEILGGDGHVVWDF